MANLFGSLQLKTFNEQELNYLEDYLKVMKSISSYLDVLQGETLLSRMRPADSGKTKGKIAPA